MERSLNQLYSKVLEYYNSFDRNGIGICENINSMFGEGCLNGKECNLIEDHMRHNKPKDRGMNGYWFDTFEERIEFLEAMIIKTCEHKHVNREDGLDECLDCGIKNY